MRHIAANVLTILALVLIGLIAAVERGRQDFAAPGPLATPKIVSVELGDTLDAGAARLAEAGLFRDTALFGLVDGAALFKIAARWEGKTNALKAGEYRVPAGASVAEILELVTSGRAIQYAVTVPEGLTSWEVVELLKQADELSGEVAEIPAEGSLAPDTYFVDRGTPRTALVARMQAAQEEILARAWAERAEGLPLASAQDALILASIVEKETGVPEERGTVASVFVNRLREGMRLETDPTVIYGITQGRGPLGRGLRRSELVRETPYNTYRIFGLPPTPIANPGRAAIAAVLDPPDTPYLFFVADGSGGHAFAETLAQHNANVRVWRRIEAQRRASGGGAGQP
ncbi:MAG: endolytic transglycosylase MltG [Pikeienuella sp.]